MIVVSSFLEVNLRTNGVTQVHRSCMLPNLEAERWKPSHHSTTCIPEQCDEDAVRSRRTTSHRELELGTRSSELGVLVIGRSKYASCELRFCIPHPTTAYVDVVVLAARCSDRRLSFSEDGYLCQRLLKYEHVLDLLPFLRLCSRGSVPSSTRFGLVHASTSGDSDRLEGYW